MEDVVHKMNEEYKVWVALISVLSKRGLRINAMKYLYEDVIVQTALYGPDMSMRSVERWKVNVFGMQCLRSLVGVSRMDE